ncbi:MAG: transporter substrate-binding domain-containing protein [bacterium]|nr:transporter substrate-binding domain-containing protein [bacterium]
MKSRMKWLVPVLALAMLAGACADNGGGSDAAAGDGQMAADMAAMEARIVELESSMDASGGGVVDGNLLDEIKDRGTLHVGMVLQFPPQMYIDDAGNPAGYDVDLMNMLAEDLGVTLEISNLEFDAMIPGLIANQFDMVSVGLVGRPARLEQLWFTCPYVPYRQVVVVNNDSGINDISELNSSGVTMTALIGSTAASLTETRFPNAELVELDQAPALLEVASGRADAIVIEEYLALPFVAENPSTSVLNPNAPFVAEEYGAWALPRGEVVWLNYLNGWLAYYISRGTLDEVYERHIGPTEGLPACN